jgi:hypothetical protein
MAGDLPQCQSATTKTQTESHPSEVLEQAKPAVQKEPVKPHRRSLIYLFLIVPSLIAGLGLWVIGEPLIVLFLFHVMLVFGPMRYNKKRQINYAEGQLKNIKRQRLLGFLISALFLCIVLAAYSMIPVISPGALNDLKLPFKTDNVLYLIILAFEFAVLNPWIEEWYWNVFLCKTIGEVYNKKKRYYFKLQVFFAAYHFFIVLHIFNLYVALVAWVFMIFAGVTLQLIRMKFGYLVSSLAHFGADFGIVICFIDMMVRKLPHTITL